MEIIENKLLKEMVRPERFELPASSSGGKRSIQLSYGRVTSVYIESLASSILVVEQFPPDSFARLRFPFLCSR